MATFISISGPSTTGKTSLVESLSTYQQLRNAVFSPDMHDVVFADLVESGLFLEFTEITSDSSYMCTYLLRIIDYYLDYMKSMESVDKLVILDGCWVDLAIYSLLNMWHTKVIKSLQAEILSKVTEYDKRISRIYMTKADDVNYPVDRFRLRGKITTFRMNRPLEIQYYRLFENLENVVPLPNSDVSACSLFIIEDLKSLGQL